jgi:hypothetical protein
VSTILDEAGADLLDEAGQSILDETTAPLALVAVTVTATVQRLATVTTVNQIGKVTAEVL